MDAGGDAVRLVLPAARPLVLRPARRLRHRPGGRTGFLAESITPNDDFTEWTIDVRPGITFHDGTPLDADAMIYNLQVAGTSLLVAAALTDLAKVPTPTTRP